MCDQNHFVKELQDFEEKQALEKHHMSVAAFGLAHTTKNQIDRQRLYHSRRLGGLPSSQLGLEVLDNRLETIDWIDTLNQPMYDSHVRQPQYRSIHKEMM